MQESKHEASTASLSSFMTQKELEELQGFVGQKLSLEDLKRMERAFVSREGQLPAGFSPALRANFLAGQGHMLRDGLGGRPKDPVAALAKYKEAAALGSADGMLNVGMTMIRGPR